MASPYTAGGIPDHNDVTLGGIFIVIFSIIGLGLHLRVWRTYGYQFVWSLLCFAFCVARIVALWLRIALESNQTNKALACVGQIVLAAGVAILLAVNIQMSRRFFGQLHPQHSRPVKYILTGACYLIDPMVILVCIAIIQAFCVTDPDILSIDRKLRTAASVVFTVLAFLPIPVVVLVLMLNSSPSSLPTITIEEAGIMEPSAPTVQSSRAVSLDGTMIGDSPSRPSEKVDGAGALVTDPHVPTTGFGLKPLTRRELVENAAVIIIPAILLTVEQAIRVAQVYYVPTPLEPLPWYMSKAAFWIVIFGLEAITILFLGLAVLPRRFTHLKAL
ncbi:hypothetical protein M408DRAFT_76728 [Serendipita vermifera MAFF 305830]|uniref:Uncharacterized protein n=1 Tax=Serendipita vermifera MAFF 305830 TaxID=933852 RepID=A0A0C2WBU9_SERVB|nr:hypothetical protein M408DRAFT_76728 [Serendipita vermifera MAFF 305830]